MVVKIMRQTYRISRRNRVIWMVSLSLLFLCSVYSLSVLASVMSVEPSSSSLSAGETFTIDVVLNASEPVKSYECSVSYNPSAFSVLSVTTGDFFEGYQSFNSSGSIDNTNGFVTELYGLIIGPGNVTAKKTLLTLHCQAKNPSSDVTSAVSLLHIGITNESGYLAVSSVNASLVVEAAESSSPPSGSSGGGGGGGGFIPPAEPEAVTPHPPEPPLPPTGPKEVFVGVEKTFFVSSWDPDGDTIRFKMSWGNENISCWSTFVESNMTVVFTHQWEK
ncbi:MAG: hypothetical protein J7M14_06460, partial [Planctomycetes bacterium]|nr:hypothetical protein [Planctomycetota bacterium]